MFDVLVSSPGRLSRYAPVRDRMDNQNMDHRKCLAVSPFTMPAALAAADQLLGGNPTWSGDHENPEQIAWVEAFRRRAQLAAGMPEIRSHAAESAQRHVKWLRGEGWEAQITQGGPNDIFLAATLNVVAKWPVAGRAYTEGSTDRVALKNAVYRSETGSKEHPVVEVVTQHPNFSFCFQQVDEAPMSTAALMAHALDMASCSANEEVDIDFPMVDLLVRSEARYMLGLSSGMNVVRQAAEQLRLELNEVGGRASAAAEITITRGMSMARIIKIDGPFIVAICRNGTPKDIDKVMFAAHCDRSVWRKPAEGRI